jgi:hypothetical protein
MTSQEYDAFLASERKALQARPLPGEIGDHLMMLERFKKITIGVNRSEAFIAWTKITTHGAILGGLGSLLLLWVVVSLLWIGWKMALLSLGVDIIYTSFIRNISRHWFRMKLLTNTQEFHVMYCAGYITIRVNETGEILSAPSDWIARIEKLA